MSLSDLISLGIGSPSGIPSFLTFGLISSDSPVDVGPQIVAGDHAYRPVANVLSFEVLPNSIEFTVRPNILEFEVMPSVYEYTVISNVLEFEVEH